MHHTACLAAAFLSNYRLCGKDDLHSRQQLDHVLVHMLQTKCYHGTEKLLQITQHVCTVLGLRMFAVNMHLNKIVESCERMVVQAQLMKPSLLH